MPTALAASIPAVEEALIAAVDWLRLATEVMGALIVATGVAIAAGTFVRNLLLRNPGAFSAVRLTLGRFLSLALEFQLGADILSTTIAPSWEQIGKLAAIAVIRTTLNLFLTRDLKDARATMAGETAVARRAATAP